MASINVDLDYFDHPKTVKLRQKLGRGSEVYPIRLWVYTAKYHCKDGVLRGYKPEELAKLIGYPDKKVIKALVGGGFLRPFKGGYFVVDFLEHNGHLSPLKKRARLAAKARWKKYAEEKKIDAQAEIKQSSSTCNSNALPIPSIPTVLTIQKETPPLPPQGGKKTGFLSQKTEEKLKTTVATNLHHAVDSEANKRAVEEIVDGVLKDKTVRNPAAVALYRAEKAK